MPSGPPQGPPSRDQYLKDGAKKWDAIRSAQAQVQRNAARQPSSRRNAGEFPGRRPFKSSGRPDLKTMARNRLTRRN